MSVSEISGVQHRVSLGNDAVVIGGRGCIQSEKQSLCCVWCYFVQKPAKGIAKNIKTSVNVMQERDLFYELLSGVCRKIRQQSSRTSVFVFLSKLIFLRFYSIPLYQDNAA